MELRAHLAQRLKDLGREHNDGQTVEQRDVAKHQTHTDLDGDESHRQSREEFENTSGEERDPQRGHCRLCVCGSKSPQMGARGLFSSESPQRRQAGHEVKELGSQTFHRGELVLRSCLRETPDKNHEDGNQRDDDECDQRRPEVEQKNHGESCRCHRADENQLGQEGDEIGAQVFESR